MEPNTVLIDLHEYNKLYERAARVEQLEKELSEVCRKCEELALRAEESKVWRATLQQLETLDEGQNQRSKRGLA